MLRTKNVLTLITVITLVMVMTGSVFAEGVEKININTASVVELIELQYVGPSYAQKIVAFRKKTALLRHLKTSCWWQVSARNLRRE